MASNKHVLFFFYLYFTFTAARFLSLITSALYCHTAQHYTYQQFDVTLNWWYNIPRLVYFIQFVSLVSFVFCLSCKVQLSSQYTKNKLIISVCCPLAVIWTPTLHDWKYKQILLVLLDVITVILIVTVGILVIIAIYWLYIFSFIISKLNCWVKSSTVICHRLMT